MQEENKRNTKLKVLLVEDNRIAQRAAHELLKEAHCEVHTAVSGSAALQLANNNHYTLILMDLGLQDIDGIMLSKKIRESNNINQNTPIIALTANSDQAIIKRCFSVGMNGFLVKPLNEDKISKIFKKLIPIKCKPIFQTD